MTMYFLGMLQEKGPDLKTTMLPTDPAFSQPGLDMIGTYIQRMVISMKWFYVNICTIDRNVWNSVITAHFVSDPKVYTVAHNPLIFTVFNIVHIAT